MGHMIAFGLIAIAAGIAEVVGSHPRGPGAEYGAAMIAAGIVAIAWAVIVLIVRIIP